MTVVYRCSASTDYLFGFLFLLAVKMLIPSIGSDSKRGGYDQFYYYVTSFRVVFASMLKFPYKFGPKKSEYVLRFRPGQRQLIRFNFVLGVA